MKNLLNFNETARMLNRRAFLARTATGIGTLALGALMNSRTQAAAAIDQRWTGIINPLHFPAKAKRVIHRSMARGPGKRERIGDEPIAPT